MADNDEIFDLITKMYSDLTNKIDGVHSEMKVMRNDISVLKTDVSQLKTDVNKNTIILEHMDNTIKLLAEGQESFRNQLGRTDEEDKRTVNERLEIIELAIKSTSKDVKVIKRRVQSTEEDVIEIQSHLKLIK